MSLLSSPNSDSESAAELPDELSGLAEEFLGAVRQGLTTDIERYCQEYPHLAERIRDLFPTLLALEQCGQSLDSKASTEAATVTASIPNRIGDYQIIREIGRGGMGIVYEAVQQSLGRRVALKVLPAHASLTPINIQRFRRESRAAAKLHHANIVPVFGVGEHEGMNYYVMQFIQGVGLDQILHQLQDAPRSSILRGVQTPNDAGPNADVDQPLSPNSIELNDSSGTSDANSSSTGDRVYWRRVALIGMQLAQALEFAHSQGVLHRDLKPANVLLDVNGTVWLTDFGLAQVHDDVDLTRTGDIVGTLRYLAPERLRGECSPQSDVYGLGITLYELLTFVPAFGETDRHALVKQVVQQVPKAPRAINRKIPRDLETIVLKAIEKEIPDRYTRAADLADDLLRFLNDRPIRARRVAALEQAWRWCRRNPIVAGLGSSVAILLLGLGFVWATLSWVSSDRLRARAAEREARTAQQFAKREQEIALSQSHLAQARGYRYGREPARKSKTLEEIKLAMQSSPQPELRFELRNEAIAALAQTDVRLGRVWKVGKAPREIGGFDSQLTRYARFDGENKATVVRLDTGDILAELAITPGFNQWLTLSGDGRYLVCASDFLEGELELWDVDAQRRVLGPLDQFTAYGFSRDSKHLIVARATGACETYQLPEAAKIDSWKTPSALRRIARSPDDRYIACAPSQPPNVVQILDANTGAKRAEWECEETVCALAWHPDGTQIAVSIGDPATIEVWSWANGRKLSQMSGHFQQCEHLAFDLSGQYVSSLSWDGSIRVWTTYLGQQIATFNEGGFVHQGHANVIGVRNLDDSLQAIEIDSPIGFTAISGGANQFPHLIRDETLIGNERILVCGSGNGLEFFDLWTNKRFGTIESPYVAQFFIDLQGGRVIAATPSGLRAASFELKDDQCNVGPFIPIKNYAERLGRAYRSADGSLWTLMSETQTQVVRADGSSVLDVRILPTKLDATLSPDGTYCIVSGWHDVNPTLWNVKTGKRLQRMQLSGRTEFRFTPDSKELIICDSEAFTFRDIDTWQDTRKLKRTDCAFPGPIGLSPNGEYIAAELSWGSIHLLRGDTYETVAKLDRPVRERYSRLSFVGSDNKLFAYTFRPGEVNLWKINELANELNQFNLGWNDSQTITTPVPFINSNQPKPVSLNYTDSHSLLDESTIIANSEKQLAQNPRDFDYANAVAWLHLIATPKNRNPRRAIEILEPIQTEVHDLGPAATNTLAVAYLRVGRYEDAVTLLRNNVRRQTEAGVCLDLYTLAMCHWHLRAEDEARNALNLAERLFRAAPLKDPQTLKETKEMREEAKALIEVALPNQ